MHAAEIEQFLTHLAVNGRVSASTQNRAINALLFLYAQVPKIDVGKLDAVRARRGKRLPAVLSSEVKWREQWSSKSLLSRSKSLVAVTGNGPSRRH